MDMDMSHTGMTGIGSDTNHAFAHDYWYLTAGVVGSLIAIRAVNHIGASKRIKASSDPSTPHPTRPDGPLSQAWATGTAIFREMSHPQYFIPIRGLNWLTPLPLGRILILVAYWAVIIYFMSWHATVHDINFYERIGYRNAWVTLTQLPMLYLLSTKVNIIGFLVGTSHERLNWLHRWVARTMFVTATVHGFYFWTEWAKADFISFELQSMPVIKYGLGAWAILLWSVVTGFIPIRRLSYEIWVAQHVASSIVMLVLVYLHVPTNARWLFWMAVAFLVFDRAARWALLLWQNVRFNTKGSACQGERYVGHQLTLRAMGESTTVVTIKDVHFKWLPGQHVYLWVPWLGPVEAHPYTIASAHQIKGACCCNSVQLIVRKHSGFSKRIHDYANKRPNSSLVGFMSGPYGAPPRWDIYETMVLIGASTGASFTIPILESAARADGTACLKSIDVALMAKTETELEYYVQRAKEACQMLRRKGVEVRLHVAITSPTTTTTTTTTAVTVTADQKTSLALEQIPSRSTSESESDDDLKKPDNSMASRAPCCCDEKAGTSGDDDDASSRDSVASLLDFVQEHTARLDMEALIRGPVERAWGETAVVVCGGPEVVARTRNCVSALSDERAVHKGSGAQGIYLHVEEYAF